MQCASRPNLKAWLMLSKGRSKLSFCGDLIRHALCSLSRPHNWGPGAADVCSWSTPGDCRPSVMLHVLFSMRDARVFGPRGHSHGAWCC